MIRIELTELATLIIGIVALYVGRTIRRSVPLLSRIDLPNAVIGALVVALLVLLGQLAFGIDVAFGGRTRDALLLVFFTAIGLSAKLSALAKGGRPLVALCGVTVLALVAQNLCGSLFAWAWGAHPAYGVLAGALSFIGGPGTAMAWAKELEAAGLKGAGLVGMGAATLALVAGALVAGPITGWIVRRHGLHEPTARQTDITFADPPPPTPAEADGSQIEQLLTTILVIAIAVFLGERLNDVARGAGLLLPGFLSAMIAGVVITNIADVMKVRLAFSPIETGGALALQLFLVIALMATPLISVAVIIVPLAITTVIQVAVTVTLAYLLLFRLLGKDYDAAVTAGGFIGFGIASMPVAMATMDEVARRYGPSPKAFLLVTLAGSFFVDLANAFVAKSFLALPPYAIHP
jgi:ESS family glutamate:Na+ symporter